MKWVIFIVGEHGTGKSSVAKELATRLEDLGVHTYTVEVSDVVRRWQTSEDNVADDAIYCTKKQSTQLHRMLWNRIELLLLSFQGVIVSGARESYLLNPRCESVRATSFGLLLSTKERRKRFTAREVKERKLTEEAAQVKWTKSEKRAKELGVREVTLGCDTLISLNLCQKVSDVVDVILTGLLLSLWRNR